jgi:hypothetical protein
MAKIKITGAKHDPDVLQPKVNKTDTMTWETDLNLDKDQYLEVSLDSTYGPNVGIGKSGEKTVDLTMSFTPAIRTPNVKVPYFLYLVTPSTGFGSPVQTTLVSGSTTGPCLVIDDIGKPPGGGPDDGDETEEKKYATHSGSHHRRG